MITGKTKIIAHLGYPTEPFKASMIYNPWFAAKGLDVAVVPLGLTGSLPYILSSRQVFFSKPKFIPSGFTQKIQ